MELGKYIFDAGRPQTKQRTEQVLPNPNSDKKNKPTKQASRSCSFFGGTFHFSPVFYFILRI